MSENTNLTTKAVTPSERFAAEAIRQYEANASGHLPITEYQKTLLNHIFVRADMGLQEMNANLERDWSKGNKKDQPEIIWQNIDIKKMAMDAVRIVELGVDALIPGHLYPIAYWRPKKCKYDLDLRIGYKGEMYYIQEAALHPVREIRVELVHQTDEFTVYKKDCAHKVEGYTFKINNPFDRGPVVGGYAYIEYEDDTSNTLVVMSLEEIMKRKPDGNSTFWAKWEQEMQYKTLVHAAAGKVILDPKKINAAAMAAAEADEYADYEAEEGQENGIDLVLEGNALAEQPPAALPEPPAEIPAPAPVRQQPVEAHTPVSRAPVTTVQPVEVPDFLRDQQRKGERRPGF